MEKQPCQIQNLAVNRFCAVDFCPTCNVFHLKIGYATLHVPPAAFVTVCNTFNSALVRFQSHQASPELEFAKGGRGIEDPLH
jgi:hypothetical protein